MAAPPSMPAPPPPEPSGGIVSPVAVVASHFCAPYVVQLAVKEKKVSLREGDFTITDTNGAVVVTVKGALISIHNRRRLLDAAGNPLLCLREKVISMHNTWEAYRGDSTRSSDLLFTAKKSSIIQPFKTEMLIYLASNTSHEACDFIMKGSFKERSCSFYLGNNSNALIAKMHREHSATSMLLGKDYFSLTVFPNVDYVFISALVVILQEIHTDKND
ncbi:Protein LURP-one-related 15 [Zea mays]|uniref:Protein LURP-one-related 15 n=1 Tax=Zea mays TaxID=4577 RepID=A0A3L6DZR0_MAIZE|nr:Protein LURP-one-related 15 [Zea mays]